MAVNLLFLNFPDNQRRKRYPCWELWWPSWRRPTSKWPLLRPTSSRCWQTGWRRCQTSLCRVSRSGRRFWSSCQVVCQKSWPFLVLRKLNSVHPKMDHSKTRFEVPILNGSLFGLLWAHFDSWRHLRRRAYLVGEHSSRAHICASEYWHYLRPVYVRVPLVFHTIVPLIDLNKDLPPNK